MGDFGVRLLGVLMGLEKDKNSRPSFEILVSLGLYTVTLRCNTSDHPCMPDGTTLLPWREDFQDSTICLVGLGFGYSWQR